MKDSITSQQSKSHLLHAFHRSAKLLQQAPVLSLFLATACFAADLSTWPLASWESADHSLSRLDSSFQKNLSGSHWDPVRKQLLLVVNKPGTVVILDHARNGFVLNHKFTFKGDLEGITKIPDIANDIFVLEEKKSEILWFRIENNTLHFIKSWSISDYLPNSGKLGPEGITFIPDSELTHLPFGKSQKQKENLFKGVFCVSHQNGGNLYFFEPSRQGIRYLGTFSTRAKESSGLEYDIENSHLYIWHNINGNSLEIVHLKHAEKDNMLQLVDHFKGPKKGNLESVAVGRLESSTSLFLTDDDNQDNVSILWYKNWTDINTLNRKR